MSYAVRAQDQPVHDQHDANDAYWLGVGGDPRDRGRFVELVSRSLTGSRTLLFGLDWLEPGETHLLHHHPETEELYFVIAGSGRFTVDGETIRGEPGTAIFIPAGARHGITNDGESTLEICWCFDRPDLAEVGIVWDE